MVSVSYKAGRSTPPPPETKQSLLGRVITLQIRRPLAILLPVLAVTAFALWLALKIQVKTGFENLLPENRPSVIELARVAKKTSGVAMIFVVLRVPQDTDPPPTLELRKAADAVVVEAKKLGPPWVGSAEDGVQGAIDFLAPRAGLYADRDKLELLRADIDARFAYEVNKASGTDLGFEDPPPDIDSKRIQQVFGTQTVDEDRYPDGYYQSKDGRTVVIAIRSQIDASDLERGSKAIDEVTHAVQRVNPSSFDARITFGLSGDLVTGISEYKAINNDLRDVGIWGVVMLVGVVLLFYLRIRTLFTMLLTMAIGVAWTFGITEVVLGHLNLATGFLFTIVAGNGINPGIIYMARYLELRRKHASVAEAIARSHAETWLPTLTAAGAASAAFASLLVTEFRGFRDFGLIGGFGMLTCWVATYLALPSILSLLERLAPTDSGEIRGTGFLARVRRLTEQGVPFGRPFAAIVKRAPRAVSLIGIAISMAGGIALYVYIAHDPMEYDLTKLRSDPSARREAIELSHLGDSITGHVGADGMAIVTETVEQVPLLEKALREVRDRAPEGKKPFDDVHALEDFIPDDQVAKIPTLLAIRDKVLRVHRKGKFSEQDWKKLEKFIPPPDLKPFTMADLPEEVARNFTETDGTRGRIVFIVPTDIKLVDDAHYLLLWADSYRETKLSDNSVVRGSGRAVIYADMWAAVLSDIPKAVLASLVCVVLVVVIAFRAGRPALAVLLSLLMGVAWMALVLVVVKVRLHFLNFIALPITFGIGVDYAVNIVERYVREGVGSAARVVRETGGAVTLCSLTTMLGYFALVSSMNYGVRSLGVAAVIGEICCLFVAVLILPAVLIWFDRGREEGSVSRFSVHPKKPD